MLSDQVISYFLSGTYFAATNDIVVMYESNSYNTEHASQRGVWESGSWICESTHIRLAGPLDVFEEKSG